MAIKVKSFLVEDNSGATIEMTESQFVQHIAENNSIPEMEGMEVADVVRGLMDQASRNSEIDEDFSKENPGISEAYDAVRDALQESKNLKQQQKDLAKEAAEATRKRKEEEKLEKEKEKAETEKRQKKFSEIVSKSTKVKDSDLAREIKAMRSALPSEFSLAQNENGDGFSLEVAEGAEINEVSLGKAIGALAGQQATSDFMTQSRGFLIGGLANAIKERGLYPSIIQAAKAIEAAMPEGIGLKQRAIESYARMDSRIPLEYRSSNGRDTYYLALANARALKPDKSSNESKEDFKEREEAYLEDRNKIAEKIKSGEFSDLKSISKAVTDFEVKHGVRESKSPQKSIPEYLKDFFYSSYILDLMDSLGKGDEIELYDKDSGDGVTYTREQLKEVREASKDKISEGYIKGVAGGKKVSAEEVSNGKVVMSTAVTEEDDNGNDVPKKDEKGEQVFEDITYDVRMVNPFS